MLGEQQVVMMQGLDMRTKGRKKEEWMKGGEEREFGENCSIANARCEGR